MSIIHESGYIVLTGREGAEVFIRVSKVAYISSLGNGGFTEIVLDGDNPVVVQETIPEVFEKIDAYIAPHLR